MNGEKMETCSRIRDITGRLALGEDEVRWIWNDYFEDLYNKDIGKQIAVYSCGLEGVQRGNYF